MEELIKNAPVAPFWILAFVMGFREARAMYLERKNGNGHGHGLPKTFEAHCNAVDGLVPVMLRVAQKLSDDSPRKHTEAIGELAASAERQYGKLCDIEQAIINGNGKAKP